jgi:hypothetical protein
LKIGAVDAFDVACIPCGASFALLALAKLDYAGKWNWFTDRLDCLVPTLSGFAGIKLVEVGYIVLGKYFADLRRGTRKVGRYL